LIYGFCPFVLFSFGYCIVCPLIYGFCPFEQKDRSRKSMDRQYNDKKKKEQKDRSRKSMDRQCHGQKKKEQKDRSRKSMDRLLLEIWENP
jgi:hypothetical protein